MEAKSVAQCELIKSKSFDFSQYCDSLQLRYK